LPEANRPAAVARLLGCEELVRALPWERWVADEPETFGPLAADAAGRYALHGLGPVLRAQAAATPSAPLLRALGELADRDAVPLLVSLLDRRRELRLVGLESLGKIGGPEARAALRAVIATAFTAPAGGPELRVAYRALAACATAEDEALFIQAAAHSDWYVRLAAVDGLGRSPHLVNAAALARLSGDPVQAVAHRALTALESRLGREE
jgi:HEAT repeat protein